MNGVWFLGSVAVAVISGTARGGGTGSYLISVRGMRACGELRHSDGDAVMAQVDVVGNVNCDGLIVAGQLAVTYQQGQGVRGCVGEVDGGSIGHVDIASVGVDGELVGSCASGNLP